MSEQDKLIGQKIRYRRLVLGLTQHNVAKAIGVTAQQVQKYELGTNRIASSRLIAICNFFGIKIEDFFKSLSETTNINKSFAFNETDSNNYNISQSNNINNSTNNTGIAKSNIDDLLVSSREMMGAFSKIKDSKLREDLLRLAKSMSEK
ncbi:MAG: helix-turn-helix transcriptional regulator [Rickettsiales bacterium]